MQKNNFLVKLYTIDGYPKYWKLSDSLQEAKEFIESVSYPKNVAPHNTVAAIIYKGKWKVESFHTKYGDVCEQDMECIPTEVYNCIIQPYEAWMLTSLNLDKE